MRRILEDGLDAPVSGCAGPAPHDAVGSPVGKARNAWVWLAVVTGSSTALPVIAPSLLMSCARVRWNAYPGTLKALRSRITPFSYRKA